MSKGRFVIHFVFICREQVEVALTELTFERVGGLQLWLHVDNGPNFLFQLVVKELEESLRNVIFREAAQAVLGLALRGKNAEVD